MATTRKRKELELLSSCDESFKENLEHDHKTRNKRARTNDSQSQLTQDERIVSGEEVNTMGSSVEVSNIKLGQEKSKSKLSQNVINSKFKQKLDTSKAFKEVRAIKSDKEKSTNRSNEKGSASKLRQALGTSKSRKEVSISKSGQERSTGTLSMGKMSSKSSKDVRKSRSNKEVSKSKSIKEVSKDKSSQEVSTRNSRQEISTGMSSSKVSTSKSGLDRKTRNSSHKVTNLSNKEVKCSDKTNAMEPEGSGNNMNGNNGVTSQELEVFNFNRKSWMTDVTFLIQGKHIYCSKTILSVFSPVFRSMFTEKKDHSKGKRLVELPGKDYESFLEFLKCFFPNITNPNITKQNVFRILALAYEYNVYYLIKQCEEYLLKSIEVREPCINTLMRFLTKAKQFNLGSLKDNCIKILAEKDPFAVQASGNKLGLQDTLQYLQGEIVLMKHKILREARIDLEKTCMAFDMSDVLQAFGGYEQAKAAKLELSLKIGKSEELNNKSASSDVVCLNGLSFSAESVVYAPSNTENEASYLNLFLKCVSDGSLAFNWSCDVRAKCILKMRMTGRKNEQITKTRTFRFSESHAFFTGLKTRLGSSIGKKSGSGRGREFEAVVYFLANRPKFSNSD